MNNNDILRRLRYAFDYGDDSMIKMFSLGGITTDRATISDWLKKDDNPEQKKLNDFSLASFLNGMIVMNRGKKEGAPLMLAEKSLNNNLILRKLKIALELKDTDLLMLLEQGGIRISKHELSAFFRKPTQDQFRLCKDQILRNFLKGLQLRYRDES